MKHIATTKGAKAIFLFIAELNGFRAGTVEDKENFGKECWVNGTLHDLNYASEKDRSELHENIWLERLYGELDSFYGLGLMANIKKSWVLNGRRPMDWLVSEPVTDHKWETPIELDASASMLQYIGVLLDDHRLTDMTNVTGERLYDPWEFDGIPRTQFKHAATPMLYGSSKACHELWHDKGHKYTVDQVKAYSKEITSGALGLANQFKEFIINNVKPTEEMTVNIWGETINIECNRFKNVGEHTDKYDIYDTDNNAIKRISHTTTKQVPDLEQFRRYFVTLLVHNLDSQGADRVIEKVVDKYGWGIDIHDAFIVNPEAAEDTRTWYAEFMDEIYRDRKTILSNYFQSIGIGKEAQGKWDRVKAMAQPIENFKCSHMALK